MTEKELQATAYHEAGRAVKAYLAERKIEYVEIGRVVFDASWYEQACKSEDVLKLEMDTELDICLAGIAAEELYLGEIYKPNFQKAKEIAKYLVDNPSDIDSFVERRYNYAKKTLKYHWEAVERVAKLIDDDECDGDFLTEYVIPDAISITTYKYLMDGTIVQRLKDLISVVDENEDEELRRKWKDLEKEINYYRQKFQQLNEAFS